MDEKNIELAEAYQEGINEGMRKENWTEVRYYAKRLLELLGP